MKKFTILIALSTFIAALTGCAATRADRPQTGGPAQATNEQPIEASRPTNDFLPPGELAVNSDGEFNSEQFLPRTGESSLGPPPISVLPAPAESKDRIPELCKRLGVRSISGSNATPEVLDSIADGLSRFPPGELRDLDVIAEPAAPLPGSLNGFANLAAYWAPATGNQRGGQIYLVQKKQYVHNMIHEAAHHVLIYARPEFNESLVASLGYEKERVNPPRFVALDVEPASFPTPYSKTNTTEHTAELIMVHLLGYKGVGDAYHRRLPTFTLPAKTAEILKRELGSGAES